jgi:acetyl-CoA synthetase
LPFFGIKHEIMGSQGTIMDGVAEGILVISLQWPEQARIIYGGHKRFIDTYFKNYLGYYFAGDGARRHEAGHCICTVEIESTLVIA